MHTTLQYIPAMDSDASFQKGRSSKNMTCTDNVIFDRKSTILTLLTFKTPFITEAVFSYFAKSYGMTYNVHHHYFKD